MSPERTSHTTSLPVRTDRAPRADQPAASDAFATLLGAHADRPDRAPSRRERQPADDSSPRARDPRPVDRHADDRRPAPAAHGPAKPAAAETDSKDAATPADDAAAKAALLALGVPTPQPVAAPTDPTPALASAQPAPVEAPQTPADALALAAAGEQPGAADQVAPLPQAAAPATAKPVSAQPAPAANMPAPSDIATQAVPVDPQAEAAATAPAADQAPADRATALPSVPAAPAQRSEAKAPSDALAGPATTNALATPTPTGDASARQGDGRPADRDQAQAAPQTVQSAAPASTTRTDFAPVAAPVPGATPATSRTTTLSQAPRAVGQLIELASQKGVQHARLNLRPVELGGIEIRLQSTAAGVTAQVVADSPEAARLLQQASDDLKRSLASHNVELLSLDVSTSGEERRDASAAGDGFGQFDESGTRGQAGFGRPQRTGADQADTDLTPPSPGTVLELPDGVLVDVLA